MMTNTTKLKGLTVFYSLLSSTAFVDHYISGQYEVAEQSKNPKPKGVACSIPLLS